MARAPEREPAPPTTLQVIAAMRRHVTFGAIADTVAYFVTGCTFTWIFGHVAAVLL